MTSQLLKLRDYQRAAIDAVTAAWDRGVRRPAVVLPTGAGKTVIFAHLASEWTGDPDRSEVGLKPTVLILVHRDELVTQTVAKLHDVAPGLSVGVVKAQRNETGAQVIVASVQTLARASRRAQLPPVGLVIVDECHHAAADSYVNVLRHVGAMGAPPRTADCPCPGGEDERVHSLGCIAERESALAVGFTATLGRADNRSLGAIWQEVAYRRDILEMIGEGHLVDVRGKAVAVPDLSLDNVRRARGDFSDGALGEALTSAHAPETVAKAYLEHASDRQGVVFCPTVAVAELTAQAFDDAGLPAALITGTTPTEVRRLIYKRYLAGDTRVLVNCMVLTEGFDMPQASCAVIMRPTQSASLYVQMVGRVLRPFPGKSDALVLDVVGAGSRHKLASIVDLTERPTVVREGESLAQAVEREQAEAQAEGDIQRAGLVAGQLRMADFDLFHRSTSAWLRTQAGVWFIPTRHCLVFLWPDGQGAYRVGRSNDPYTLRGGAAGWLREDAMTLEYAMAWAEQEATALDETVALRDRPWRKSKNIGPGQRSVAERLGIPVDGRRKGEISDDISRAYASRLFDRMVT